MKLPAPDTVLDPQLSVPLFVAVPPEATTFSESVTAAPLVTLKPLAKVVVPVPVTLVDEPINVKLLMLVFTVRVPLLIKLPFKVMGMDPEINVLPVPTVKEPLTLNFAVTALFVMFQNTVPEPVAPTNMLPCMVTIPVPVAVAFTGQAPELLSTT